MVILAAYLIAKMSNQVNSKIHNAEHKRKACAAKISVGYFHRIHRVEWDGNG